MTSFSIEVLSSATMRSDGATYTKDTNGWQWFGTHYAGETYYAGFRCRVAEASLPANLANINSVTLGLVSNNSNASQSIGQFACVPNALDWNSTTASPISQYSETYGTVTWNPSSWTINVRKYSAELATMVRTALANATNVGGYRYFGLIWKPGTPVAVGVVQMFTPGYTANTAYRPNILATHTETLDQTITNRSATTRAIGGGVRTGSAAYIKRNDMNYHDGYGSSVDRKLDLYEPLDGQSTHPLITFTVGGSFVAAEEEGLDYGELIAALIRGYTLASVDYKVAVNTVSSNTGSNHPEPAQDLLCALGTMYTNSNFAINTTKGPILTGHSAGSHIAMQVALMMHDKSHAQWSYNSNGNRRSTYWVDGVLQTGSKVIELTQGSPNRVGVPAPRGYFGWATPSKVDQALADNVAAGTLIDYLSAYLGGETDNEPVFGYSAGAATYHNGEINLPDWIRGHGPTGSETASVWNYKPTVVDGEILPDGRHLPHFPIGIYQGYADVVIGNGDGNYYGTRTALLEIGWDAPFAAEPANGAYTGSYNTTGGVSSYAYKDADFPYALGHDVVYQWQGNNGWVFGGWLDAAIDKNWMVARPAAMSAAVSGYSGVVTTGQDTTMPLKVGAGQVDSMKVGAGAVTRVYMGSDQLWSV